MNWLKVVRLVRALAWYVAAGLAIYTTWYTEDRIHRLEMSAPQACSFAAVNLIELLTLYIIIRAFDMALELRERGMLEKAAKSRPLRTTPD